MKLFGKNVEPACEYCEVGWPDQNGQMIFCPKNVVVSPYSACRKFKYAPLKRRPRGTPLLPQYRREDFEL